MAHLINSVLIAWIATSATALFAGEPTSNAAKEPMTLLGNYLPKTLDTVSWSDPSEDLDPKKDPIAQINAKVREFHEALIEAYPQYAAVNVPYIVSTSAISNNGFVSGGHRCYLLPVPISFGGEPNRSRKQVSTIIFEAGGNTGMDGYKDGCRETVRVSLAMLPAILAANRAQSGCQLDWQEGMDEIKLGEGCAVGGWASANRITHAGGLVLWYTQRYVVIAEDILKGPEVQAWSTVFHELGHYYLGHPANHNSGWNHYYEFAKREPFRKPSVMTQADLSPAEDGFELKLLYHYSRVYMAKVNNEAAWPQMSLSDVTSKMAVSLKYKISKHTAEMMADEFGLLARQVMALPLPEDYVDDLRFLFKADLYPSNPYKFGEAECDELFDHGLPGGYAPFGDFMESHASTCHRVFNLYVHRQYLSE